MILEEINPELFLWELYDPNGLYELDDALCTDANFGYCDASRLRVRPRAGEYALMVELWNGTKYWCHADKRILDSIRRRIKRRKAVTKPLVALPCTAQELQNALHAVCDHGGLWDANIRVVLVKPQGYYSLEFYDIKTETEGEK